MTEVENLTYLVGTPEDRCLLLHSIDDKEKLIDLFNQFKNHEKLKPKAYLFLMLNPNLPEGVLNHDEITHHIESMAEQELSIIADFIKPGKVVSLETLKLLVTTLGTCLVEKYPMKSNVSIKGYQPYFIQNKGPIARMKVITRVIQFPHGDPTIYNSLEELLLSKKSGFVKYFLSALIKVSANPKFLEFYFIFCFLDFAFLEPFLAFFFFLPFSVTGSPFIAWSAVDFSPETL